MTPEDAALHHANAFINSMNVSFVGPHALKKVEIVSTEKAERKDYVTHIASRIEGKASEELTNATRRYVAFLHKNGVSLDEDDFKRAHAFLYAVKTNHGLAKSVGRKIMSSAKSLMQCTLHAAARHHGDESGHFENELPESIEVRNASFKLFHKVHVDTSKRSYQEFEALK